MTTTEDSGIPAATAEDRPGPGETAEATTPTIEHPDAELLRLEQELAAATDAGNAAATDEEAEPFLDLATDLRHRLAELPAHTLDGIIVKFDDYVRLHEVNASSVWDEDFLRTIREGLERLKPSADAKLFTLEVELKAAHEGFHAAAAVVGSTDEDHQPWYDRMIAVEEAAQAIPAQTAMGVLAKVRMAAWYQHPKPSEDNEAHEIWLRNIVADAQRVGAAVPVDPDAAPQDLWQEFLQNRVEWNRAKEDTDEYERCGKESSAIAERITAIPAQGVYGLAVKLMIGTNVLYENRTLADEKYQDERAVISARDDAMRLSGLGGAA